MRPTSVRGLYWSSAIVAASLICSGFSSSHQAPSNAFAVASIRPSNQIVGRDRQPSKLSFQPDVVRGRNVSLKILIVEAYGLRPYQVIGGPDWLDEQEYDVEARSDGPATRDDLRRMMQTLITERFQFSFHRETRQTNIRALVVDKGGPKIRPLTDSSESSPVASSDFRGDLQDLADLIGVQLSIPTPAVPPDPTRPIIATGPPEPVVDLTGLHGTYELTLDLTQEVGFDLFTSWQRFLQEYCGLKLESRKSDVPVLVVEKAGRMPLPN